MPDAAAVISQLMLFCSEVLQSPRRETYHFALSGEQDQVTREAACQLARVQGIGREDRFRTESPW